MAGLGRGVHGTIAAGCEVTVRTELGRGAGAALEPRGHPEAGAARRVAARRRAQRAALALAVQAIQPLAQREHLGVIGPVGRLVRARARGRAGLGLGLGLGLGVGVGVGHLEHVPRLLEGE